MPYQPYTDKQYYANEYKGSIIPEEERDWRLQQSSRHIDSLTYNRIQERRFPSLTEFQRDIVREAVCRQADFEYDNSDLIESVLSSYGINGVSIQFGNSWNVITRNGVAMKKDLYALLSQTGFCCRLAVR